MGCSILERRDALEPGGGREGLSIQIWYKFIADKNSAVGVGCSFWLIVLSAGLLGLKFMW